MVTINREEIKTHIVHRYENLLLDQVVAKEHGAGEGELSLCIQNDDDLGRHLFLKTISNDKKVICIPIFMEILALASIVVTGKLPENHVALFAGITQFEKHGHLESDVQAKGVVQKVSDKAGFLKYKGTLSNNNQEVCSGELTAIFVDVTTLSNDAVKKTNSVPEANTTINLDKTKYSKIPEMIICDTLLKVNETECLGEYVYPSDHPLIKGHFPGDPVMMGVMQWMSIEDTLCAYLEATQQEGVTRHSVQAKIYNQDKVLVADMRGIECQSWIQTGDRPNQSEIQKTKKITFRNRVKPGDTLSIHLSSIVAL